MNFNIIFKSLQRTSIRSTLQAYSMEVTIVDVYNKVIRIKGV